MVGGFTRDMRRTFEKHQFYIERIRRSSREILVASALTVAALAFLVAALLGATIPTHHHRDVGPVAAEKNVIE